MNKQKKLKGFTIVELVIVIAVIAILAAVLIPTFSNVISNAKDSAALYEAKNAHTQYAVSHATEEMSDYFLYQKEENRIVAKENQQHASRMGLLGKPVRCIETGISFLNSRDAERQTGICSRNIRSVCAGKVKSAGGYHWAWG